MIYFYDGSYEAFLTAFVAAFRDPEAQIASSDRQLLLGQKTVYIAADPAVATRAESRLASFDRAAPQKLRYLLRSGCTGRDGVIFRYFRFLAEQKRPVDQMLAEDCVREAMEMKERIGRELDRMHGFVRFMESASGALYAPVSPDHDICDLLASYFEKRLPAYPFVIHDLGRKKAAVYDGTTLFLAPLDRADLLLSADETAWQALWRQYCKSVNIPSRERLKQMRGYMPVRYWKHLTELF